MIQKYMFEFSKIIFALSRIWSNRNDTEKIGMALCTKDDSLDQRDATNFSVRVLFRGFFLRSLKTSA